MMDLDSPQGRLTTKWNDMFKGRQPAHVTVYASPDFFKSYEDSLMAITRLVVQTDLDGNTVVYPNNEGQKWLAFKSAQMRVDSSLPPDTFNMVIDS